MSCSICGSTENVINHHESYFPEKIIKVCRKCHKKLHSEKDYHPEEFYGNKVFVTITDEAHNTLKKERLPIMQNNEYKREETFSEVIIRLAKEAKA